MFSPADSDGVLAELGDKFPLALVAATNAARDDLDELRQLRPGWVLGMFQREIAGFVHSRIWSHLTSELDGVAGVTSAPRNPIAK